MPLLSPIAWDHYLVILLLPLSVLGRRCLTLEAPWSSLLGYLLLVLVLSVPDTTFTWPSSLIAAPALRIATNLFFLPLRTYALFALCAWLGRLVAQAGEAL